MISRLIIVAIATISLSGCIATPRLELAETYTFDHVHVVQEPMSYNDIMCCYDCTV
ncbi:MAG: hypothetical protein ACK502_03820 [Alphaproteobacteria bacterium]